MENLGLLTAIGAALAWGSYAVPLKISQSQKLIQFQALMGTGILASGVLFSLVANYPFRLNVWGLLSGLLWASANAISLIAITNLGLSRAIPILASLVILSSFLWGSLVFNELPSGVVSGFIGIGLIISGAVLVSTTGSTQSQSIKKGLVAAIAAGLIFGSQLAPLKIGHVATKDFFFSLCVGIFVTALFIAFLVREKFKNAPYKEGLISGLVWNVGNLASLISISLIGLAKAIPISQSSTLVAVLWGLFYFREITQPKKKVQVLVGAAILLLGVITLGLA
ncbi:hypothetical protein HYT18_01435 [Candidatus Microgenomates bacterium]|nr:hypothetical protein [Candidatus Microgenomates bacterium]